MQCTGELAGAVRAGLERMDETYHPIAGKCHVCLGKSDRELAGFVTDRERIECALHEQSLGDIDEIGSGAHIAPKTACKHLARNGGLQRLPGSRNPNSAAGEAALEIGHRCPLRTDDEADHLVDRPHLPRGGAQSLHPRGGLSRSGIECVTVHSAVHRMSPSTRLWPR